MVTSRRSRFPQLGGEGVPRHVHSQEGEPRFTQSGAPLIKHSFDAPDLGNTATKRAGISNFVHSIEEAPAQTVASGMQWYPRVHGAVTKGIRGRGFLSGASDKALSGAGLVAAVSPNMDWDNNNIDAFREMKSLSGAQWSDIAAGHPRYKDHVRGMSISAAPLGNLQKAGRIIAGEHPDEVLDPRTAPKTNSFMHNIADPSNPHHVTIDGRAFDTITNRMRPWAVGRGISSSATKSGNMTRYDHAADIVRSVANGMGIDPSAAQAISWEHTKYNVEQDFGRRKQGPTRRGQPYFDPQTGAPAAHRRGRD